MDIEKMKVAELRAELSSRGLDTKGTKPVLLVRLKEAMDAEEGGEEAEGSKAEAKVTEEAEEMQDQGDEAEEEQDMEEGDEQEEEEAEEENNETTENEDTEMKEEDESEKQEENKEDQEESKEKQEENKKEQEENKKEQEEQKENKDEQEKSKEEQEENKETKEESKEESKAKEGNKNKKTEQESKPQQKRGQKRKHNEEEKFVVIEDEPEIEESLLCLDWLNSDLNLRISKDDFMTAEPFFKDGWGLVWAGARSTFGFSGGKIYFQVKLLENLEAKVEGEKEGHQFRIGFSTDDSSLQLGENACSFAYTSDGKKATDSKFEDYGVTFAKDDVITAYLDLSDNSKAIISFSKNDEHQGQAFEVSLSDLEGKALFPHVSTRNVKFEVNFGKNKDGSDREPWCQPQEGFVFAAVADSETRVRGMERVSKREDCEMILLVGLPGSGKTYWANNHVQQHPEKRYYVIGTNALVERMKVNGEPKKKHFSGKWDNLIQKCTRCLQDWLRVASQRRRNYIIDQTNVYPNAQKRKVRPFEGMTRKAVVIVPSEETYKERVEAQIKAESKDVPDTAVMEMKAHFTLPPEGEESPFKEIIFAELNREEATKLVEKYNKDAKSKGYGKRNDNKRMRGNMKMRGRMNFRGGPPGRFMPNYRHGMRGMMRGMPPGAMGMRGGPMMRGGPPAPFNGFPRQMRGGPHRGGGGQNRSGGGGGGGGGGGRGRMGGGQQRSGGGRGPNNPPMHRQGGNRSGGNRQGGRNNQDGRNSSQWRQPHRPSGWGPWNQNMGGSAGGGGKFGPGMSMGGGSGFGQAPMGAGGMNMGMGASGQGMGMNMGMGSVGNMGGGGFGSGMSGGGGQQQGGFGSWNSGRSAMQQPMRQGNFGGPSPWSNQGQGGGNWGRNQGGGFGNQGFGGGGGGYPGNQRWGGGFNR